MTNRLVKTAHRIIKEVLRPDPTAKISFSLLHYLNGSSDKLYLQSHGFETSQAGYLDLISALPKLVKTHEFKVVPQPPSLTSNFILLPHEIFGFRVEEAPPEENILMLLLIAYQAELISDYQIMRELAREAQLEEKFVFANMGNLH